MTAPPGTRRAAGVTATPVRMARRLAAPEPGWTAVADAVVVGSGIAGLTAALRLRQQVGRVLLVTKSELPSGSTLWAQGGIAAALDPADSPGAHLIDTLVAGVGLCDEQAVKVLVTEGPPRVRFPEPIPRTAVCRCPPVAGACNTCCASRPGARNCRKALR